MKKNYLSFSKLLSRRILMVNVVTISVIALLVIAFAIEGLKTMTNAYFISGLYASHESISKRLGEMSDDSLYWHIRKMDIGMNAFNPLFDDDINEKDDKDVWAYNVVIDSVGNYIYHPDRQRIGKGNFFDDIRQSDDALRQALALGLNSGEVGHQKITMDGASSYIFYSGVKDTSWRNAIVVPRNGLLIPVIITGLILLTIIVLGLLTAYWISRFTIRRATIPLRLLTKSADEVAKGNFQAPLPELVHNDEISQLRDSFGNMQQALTQYIVQLQTTILLYTDGLDEATNNELKLFSNDRVLDELNRAVQDGQLAPRAVIDRMTQAVHAFVGGAEQSDDLTMLCLRLTSK